MTAQEPEPTKVDQPVELKEVSSEELFHGQNRLVIRHNGEKYRLLITRNGKLVLQK